MDQISYEGILFYLVILFNKTEKITCQLFTNFLRSEDFRQLDYTVKASQNLNLM